MLTKEFIDFVIPALRATKTPLSTVFLNYNSMDGFVSSKTDTGTDDLTIAMFCGDHGLISAAEVSQRRITEQAISTITEEDTDVVVVVYVGVSCFHEALKSAVEISNLSDRVHVYVLCCDCVKDNDMDTFLNPLVQRGTLAGIVTTSECGARTEMARIINSLQTQFVA